MHVEDPIVKPDDPEVASQTTTAPFSSSAAKPSAHGVTDITFAPAASREVIVWAIGNGRNRANWEVTTLKHTRNVLKLITILAFGGRDGSDLVPDGSKQIFFNQAMESGSEGDTIDSEW